MKAVNDGICESSKLQDFVKAESLLKARKLQNVSESRELAESS